MDSTANNSRLAVLSVIDRFDDERKLKIYIFIVKNLAGPHKSCLSMTNGEVN